MTSSGYNKWLAVLGGFISAVAGPTLIGSSFGVFFVALLDTTEWTRTQISVAYAIGPIVSGLSAPFVGKLSERIGPRKVMMIGAGIIFLNGLMQSLMQDIWHFWGIAVMLGVTMALTGVIPVTLLVSQWFTKGRGLALGIALSGAVAALAIAPLAQFLIDGFGWRKAYFMLGLGASLLLFSVALFVVRDAPKSGAAAADDLPIAGGRRAGGASIKQVVFTPTFGLLAASGFFFFVVVSGIFAHVVPMAVDQGFSKQAAALALGSVLGVQVLGNIGIGHIADRFDLKAVLILTLVLQVVALATFGIGAGAATFWAFAILFSIGVGGNNVVAPLILAERFGQRLLGSTMGISWLICTSGSILGPVLGGWSRDATGNYTLAIILYGASLILSVLCAALVPSRKTLAPGAVPA